MSILGTTSYIIKHHVIKGGFPLPSEVYVDNFENLRRSITATWSKIPHRVAVNDLEVQVFSEPANELLAKFEFKALPSAKFPDHF